MDGRIPRGRQRRWAWKKWRGERGTIPGGDFSPGGTRENLLKPFLRKSILYARSIFAIAKSPILLRIERRRDGLLRRSNHDRFTDRARAPRPRRHTTVSCHDGFVDEFTTLPPPLSLPPSSLASRDKLALPA